jgi:hypothetical protein
MAGWARNGCPKEIPRRNNVSEAARAWVFARTLGSGFVALSFHCAANVS